MLNRPSPLALQCLGSSMKSWSASSWAWATCVWTIAHPWCSKTRPRSSRLWHLRLLLHWVIKSLQSQVNLNSGCEVLLPIASATREWNDHSRNHCLETANCRPMIQGNMYQDANTSRSRTIFQQTVSKNGFPKTVFQKRFSQKRFQPKTVPTKKILKIS